MVVVQEGQVDEGRGLDAVEAVACALGVLHLRSIGVGADRGVTLPAVRRHQVARTVGTVGVHEVHVDELLVGVVLVHVVQRRGERSKVTQRRQVLVVAQTHVRAVALRVGVVDVATNLEEAVHFSSNVRACGEALVVGVDHQTVDVGPAQREVVLRLVVTTIERSTILLLQGGTRHLLLPVDGVHALHVGAVPELVDEHRTVVGLGLLDGLGILVEAQHVEAVGQRLQTQVGSQRDVGLALRTVLRGDHHHTVGTSRTVDGGGRGVLQDFDTLNVGGVHEVGTRAYLHTVYNIKR